MASVYARGKRLYVRLKGLKVVGRWDLKKTKYFVGEEREAARYAEGAQAILDKRHRLGKTSTSDEPLTLSGWIEEWIPLRKESDHDYKRDRARLDHHVLPDLGDLELPDVTTVRVAELVHALRFRSSPKLANRTVRNIYTVLSAAMRDAAFKGYIATSPCILTEAQLGPIKDKDPEWREGALYTRGEAETMISHPQIPADRQLVYGFGLLAGMRPGEIATLRWRHYDPTSEPLSRLLIATSYNTVAHVTKGTKTDTTKWIPVHPTLAAMLAEWKLSGWAAMFGRAPNPDDLIVPLPPDVKRKRRGEPYRGYNYTGRRWRDVDLKMLGWRPRSVYDTKSTFITLAIDDGADRSILRDRVTHTKQKKNAFDGYDRGPHFVQTCVEVAKLRVARQFRTELGTALTKPPTSQENLSSEGGDRTLTRVRDDAPKFTVLDGERSGAVAAQDASRTDVVLRLGTALARAVLARNTRQSRALATELLAFVPAASGPSDHLHRQSLA